jgi:acetoacetate decarboxylase
MTTSAYTSGLRGYTLPLSPTGRSSIVGSPPWHFSGEILLVEYLADETAVREFLPPELRRGDVDGRAAAIFGDWQFCSDGGEELADPARSQHRELAIVVACSSEGEPAARCAFCWVDTDVSLVRGLIQGYPKKLGSIAMTRSFGIGRADAPLRRGSVFAATMSAGGHRLAEATVTLEARTDPPALMLTPLVHTRRLPPWDPAQPPLEELVTGGSFDQTCGEVWSGPAELALYDSPTDDLALLAPVEVGNGYRFSFAETLRGGRLLGE